MGDLGWERVDCKRNGEGEFESWGRRPRRSLRKRICSLGPFITELGCDLYADDAPTVMIVSAILSRGSGDLESKWIEGGTVDVRLL